MKIKIIIFLVLGVFAGSTLFAQSLTPTVISSSGGYYSNAAGSLSATVAEMTMVQTFSSTGNFLTQGFQQPGDWYASVNEDVLISDNVSISPNPSDGNFEIAVETSESGTCSINIYALYGQKISTVDLDVSEGVNFKSFDLRSYPQGIYLLEYIFTANNGKKDSKTIKINIVH
ncbi:MAG TPA: T9SS type A sorting domain-containing protein [Bacteroidales bacterium]|nr:T9SS type A sorting domain-containing protein [Bacteroidales bacterium]